MKKLKVLIMMQDNSIIAVHSNFDFEYVIIENDNPHSKVFPEILQPDCVVKEGFNELFLSMDEDDKDQVQIRKELAELNF